MCRKIKYIYESDAVNILNKLTRIRLEGNCPKDRREIRHYFCNRCGSWHLTSVGQQI